ncbi:MAG: hypothetical protein RL557_730 [archaeon]|jgi:hypothetical protein
MILITGDVHAKNLDHWEQKQVGSEVKVSLEYLKILGRYDLSATLFINGICLIKEKEDVKKLVNFDVEFGGHTFDNFGYTPPVKSYFNRKMYGCVYGSKRYQEKDIQNTKKAFEEFGLKMNSWRTHAFASNDTTFQLLTNYNVRYVSDIIGEVRPTRINGIIHVPINIPIDQNTIAYGKLTPENRDSFASCVKGRIRPSEWFNIVKKRVMENEKNGILSVLLLHPATMGYIENFKLFNDVCAFLSKFKSIKISEVSCD